MRAVVLAALVAVAPSFALANGDAGKCFDKGLGRYVECPKPKVEPERVEIIEKEPLRWTGLYIGAHLGGAYADFDGSFDGVPENANDLSLDFDDLSKAGFAGGLLIGFDYQFNNNFVIGLEIDGTATSIRDRISNNDANPNEFADVDINALASARGRIGYVFGRFKPFVTAGVGAIFYEATVANNVASGPQFKMRKDIDETAIAPVVGAGLDVMLSRRVSVGAEFLYYFASDATSITDVSDSDPGEEFELKDVWTARAKLKFRF